MYSDSLPMNTNKLLFGHFRHSYYSVRYSMNEPEGKKQLFAVTYQDGNVRVQTGPHHDGFVVDEC